MKLTEKKAFRRTGATRLSGDGHTGSARTTILHGGDLLAQKGTPING